MHFWEQPTRFPNWLTVLQPRLLSVGSRSWKSLQCSVEGEPLLDLHKHTPQIAHFEGHGLDSMPRWYWTPKHCSYKTHIRSRTWCLVCSCEGAIVCISQW
jgi:hypothetical protein